MNIINTYNLTEKGKAPRFSDISLSVEGGMIYGLIEISGEIKDSLLDTLLMPNHKYIGEIDLFGKRVIDDVDIRKRIGVVTSKLIFFDGLSVYDNLKLHNEYCGYYDNQRIDEVLKMLKIDDQRDLLIGEISLNTKKKLAFARAIMTKPELLILDGVIDGIDAEGVSDIVDILRSLRIAKRTTILLASHNLAEIEGLVDKVGILYEGRLVTEKDIKDIIGSNTAHYEIGVSDLKRASLLLIDELEISNFKVIEPGQINIYDTRIHQNDVLALFIDEELEINNFSVRRTTLKDFCMGMEW